jgi:thiamine biosynthesis lipoprotein
MPLSPTRRTRRDFLLMGAAAMAAPRLARADTVPVRSFGGRAFGTQWAVTLPDGTPDEALHESIDAFLLRTDRMMSPWRADSELSRFNAAPAGGLRVSPQTLQVTGAALDLARASGGAFDPTVGPLVARWGFGPIAGGDEPDWRMLATANGVLEKTRADATLDLCGLAKGWALDGMGALLRRAGHHAFLLDLGGELIASGRHPEGRRWRVGIEDPRPRWDGLTASLALDNAAVATSGRKANGYTLGARRYSHIIDPASRAPVVGRLEQVSVIARDAMTADGWATALMAAGVDGPALAERNDIAALFLSSDSGRIYRRMTGTFARHMI